MKLLLKNSPDPKRVACEIKIFKKLRQTKHSNGKLSAHGLKKMWSW